MYGTFFGRRSRVSATPSSTNSSKGDVPFRYIVQAGDTLASISKKTKISVDLIRQLNPDLHGKKLYIGQSLLVDELTKLTLPPPPDLIDEGWGQMHVVRPSDTLSSIAIEYNTTEGTLRKDNRQYFPVGEKGQLFPGQLLVVRLVNTYTKELCEEEPEGYLYHTVKLQDTFESICNLYEISYSTLLSLNPIHFPVGSRCDLHEGQKLLVKNHLNKKDYHIGEIILTKMIHIVTKEDCIESILKKYKMNLDELREWNRVYFPRGYKGEIYSGMKLVVRKI